MPAAVNIDRESRDTRWGILDDVLNELHARSAGVDYGLVSSDFGTFLSVLLSRHYWSVFTWAGRRTILWCYSNWSWQGVLELSFLMSQVLSRRFDAPADPSYVVGGGGRSGVGGKMSTGRSVLADTVNDHRPGFSKCGIARTR